MTMPTQRKSGFTLLELLVSMTLGLLVMGAMASLFKTGMNSTFLVAQRAETQQNMRAAVDLITKDVNMAGAGFTGAVQLPSGANSSLSKYGCDQGGTCYVPNYTYPGTNQMYGIIPGYKNGVQGNAVIPQAPPPAINDSITVAYVDYNFPLWEYNAQFATATNISGVTMTANPIYTTPPPPAINSAGGLQQGDIVFFPAGPAVAEVTNVTTGTITFGDLDALNINQSNAGTNMLKNVAGVANAATVPPTSTVCYRMFVVTYYLTVPPAGQLPRLMRQVNGMSPVPVADDIINLQFAYDVYNQSTNALDSNQPNPLGLGDSPSLIQKINVAVMGQSMVQNGNRSQNMNLATSVSARNMAFRNRYQ